MKNFVQAGQYLTVPAPSGGVSSGDGVLIDHLFGIAATTAAEGDDVEIATDGVFDIAKESGAAVTRGAPAYWDAAAKVVTPDASNSAGTNLRIGTASAAAAGADATARVKINGHAS